MRQLEKAQQVTSRSKYLLPRPNDVSDQTKEAEYYHEIDLRLGISSTKD